MDSILEEYAARVEQLHRLEDELVYTTDPAMREFLEGQIETQLNIIADLTEEALNAGGSYNDLGVLINDAAAAAVANPIKLEEFRPEWVIDDAIGGGFTGAGHGLAMVGNAATFHQIDSLDTYVDDLIAQNGGAYTYANISAHVGAYAAEAAVGVWAYQVFINPPTLYHFTSSTAAESIASSGAINAGGGLFGRGVYASSINKPFVARLMGAQSTEAVITIVSSDVLKYPTLIPGAWRIVHDVLIK